MQSGPDIGPAGVAAATRVKICGISSLADAMAAIDAGADALGFNGYAGSRRYLPLKEAAVWIGDLPPLVSRVAVLVNPTEAEVIALRDLGCFDWIQLHGDEPDVLVERLMERGIAVLRALRLRADAVPPSPPPLATAFLLDTHAPSQYGGTGQTLDPTAAGLWLEALRPRPVLLAGGLDAANVAGVVRQNRPYGVDVASGVEEEPGVKSPQKMRAFVLAAKGAHASK